MTEEVETAMLWARCWLMLHEMSLQMGWEKSWRERWREGTDFPCIYPASQRKLYIWCPCLAALHVTEGESVGRAWAHFSKQLETKNAAQPETKNAVLCRKSTYSAGLAFGMCQCSRQQRALRRQQQVLLGRQHGGNFHLAVTSTKRKLMFQPPQHSSLLPENAIFIQKSF